MNHPCKHIVMLLFLSIIVTKAGIPKPLFSSAGYCIPSQVVYQVTAYNSPDTTLPVTDNTEAEGMFNMARINAGVTKTQADTALIPNAFTPNGDQYNDLFLKGHHLIVFDRWGLKLYEGNDGWDGKYNGKNMAAGTYYYLREQKDNAGKTTTTSKGTVLLIR